MNSRKAEEPILEEPVLEDESRSRHKVPLEFDQEGEMIVFPSPSKTGKSYCVNYLLNELWKTGKYKFICLFTGMNRTQFSHIENETCHFGDWTEEKFEAYYNMLQQRRDQKQSVPNILIMDDCLHDVKNNRLFRKFIGGFRHFFTTVFICTQYPTDVTTQIRTQANKAIIHYQKGYGSRANFANFGYSFDSYSDFEEALGNLEEYEALVINKNYRPHKPEHCTRFLAPAQYKKVRIKF